MAKVFADDIELNYTGSLHWLILVKSTVYDTGGNNNGYLNSGETADITVTLKHLGGVDFTNLSTTLESSDPNVTITDNAAYFGYLAVDSIKENTDDPYAVSVSSSAPQGHIATFNLIASDSGFVDTLDMKLAINPYDYLAWNPDPTPLPGRTIDSVLTSLGYTGIDTMVLPNSDLMLYQAMFICLGVYPQKHIIYDTSYEASLVVDYLNEGGKVYLEGGDVWFFDPYYCGGYDFGTLFGIDGVSDGTSDMGPVIGVAGTFTEQMVFEYAGENNYMDHTNPIGTGFLIFLDSIPGYNCGIANDVGMYRTVGVSFELGGLVDGSGVSTKAALLDSIMHFFGLFPTGIKEITKLYINVPTLSVYPNPFHDRIKINYSISQETKGSTMIIYDATGRRVREFSVESIISGPQSVFWDGTDNQQRKLSCGVYFIKLETADWRETKKVILLK